MKQTRAAIFLKRSVLLGVVWVALGATDLASLVVGGATALSGAWLSLKLLPPDGGGVRLWPLARMLPGFLWQSIRGGIDVAWRAFHPRMPLSPGWVAVPTSLPEGGSRALLGGEFSLMPGTLVAGSRDGELLVHFLNADEKIAEAVRAEEARIAHVAGIEDGREGR